MDRGLGSTMSLSERWQSDSRGTRLRAQDFDTRMQDRTGGKPLCAILVLPVAAQAGLGQDGGRIAGAHYPLYAPVAVDRETLKTLLDSKRADIDHVHQTISGATLQARTLNNTSQEQYLDDYAAGALAAVCTWSKEDDASPGPITVTPAANQQSPAADRTLSL